MFFTNIPRSNKKGSCLNLSVKVHKIWSKQCWKTVNSVSEGVVVSPNWLNICGLYFHIVKVLELAFNFIIMISPQLLLKHNICVSALENWQISNTVEYHTDTIGILPNCPYYGGVLNWEVGHCFACHTHQWGSSVSTQTSQRKPKGEGDISISGILVSYASHLHDDPCGTAVLPLVIALRCVAWLSSLTNAIWPFGTGSSVHNTEWGRVLNSEVR